MSSYKVAQNPSTILKSVDTPNTPNTPNTSNTSSELYSIAEVFCEACNQIAKAYIDNYTETNMFQTINLSFALKIIKKTKIQFNQVVISLVYLNRYYKLCTSLNKHIPGHEEAIIPTLAHVILLCIIQAERYVNDIPHKLSWWADVCAGQTKASDINKWQIDFFNTINYNLYVHPERDYYVFKREIRRIASRLIDNTLIMPPQLRRSVRLGNQDQQNTSSHSSHIPSQPNIVRTEPTTTLPQPKVLLSPLYSGHSNTNLVPIIARVNSNRAKIVASPVASNHSINTNQQTQVHNLDVPVLNITNTNLTTSPLGIEGSMINQTRSPSSIYTNSQTSTNSDTNVNQLHPVQNPNHLMVQSRHHLSPINKRINNKLQQSTSITNTIQYTQSPVQYMTSSPLSSKEMVRSPIDMIKTENQEIGVIRPKPIKRKRSYYDPTVLSKIVQDFKKKKIMTISPEELDYKPDTSNKARPMEENKKNESIPSIVLMNQKVVVSPSIITIQSQDSSTSNQKDTYRFRGDEQVVNSMNKGKSEAGTSSHSFRTSESLNIENTSEVLPSTSSDNAIESDENANNEDIYESLHLANSITLIPVSPPLTPQ